MLQNQETDKSRTSNKVKINSKLPFIAETNVFLHTNVNEGILMTNNRINFDNLFIKFR